VAYFLTVTQTVENHKSYSQDWPNYHLVQNNEKDYSQDLLAALAETIQQPEPKGGKKGGRPTGSHCQCDFHLVPERGNESKNDLTRFPVASILSGSRNDCFFHPHRNRRSRSSVVMTPIRLPSSSTTNRR